MTPDVREVLATSLLRDAGLQDEGQFSEIASDWDEVCFLVRTDSESQPDIVELALRFWDDWGDAARHDWKYHRPFVKDDWPRMARAIAESLRQNEMVTDERLVAHFLPTRRPPSLIQRITQAFKRERSQETPDNLRVDLVRPEAEDAPAEEGRLEVLFQVCIEPGGAVVATVDPDPALDLDESAGCEMGEVGAPSAGRVEAELALQLRPAGGLPQQQEPLFEPGARRIRPEARARHAPGRESISIETPGRT